MRTADKQGEKAMTTMSQLGEKAFIESIIPNLKVDKTFINGFGHDASLIDIGLDQLIACKIDRAPFPVAIRRGIGSYRIWGRLAVAANVSDLLAIGATPRAMMVSLVVPKEFDANCAREIILGCEEACISHSIAFVGGDTKEGSSAQVVGAAWGTALRGTEFGRAKARPGDRLFIAGKLGGFSGSMAMIEKTEPNDPIPAKWTNILAMPMAKVAEGRYMRESLKVSAASDLSDGLADAIRIFCDNDTGITLFEEKLPMHRIARHASHALNVPLWRFALGVGDWAIAFVVRQSEAKAFIDEAPHDLELFEIGQFDETKSVAIKDKHGVKHGIPKLINEHFRKRAEDNSEYLHELLYKK